MCLNDSGGGLQRGRGVGRPWVHSSNSIKGSDSPGCTEAQERFGEGFHLVHESVHFSLLSGHRTYKLPIDDSQAKGSCWLGVCCVRGMLVSLMGCEIRTLIVPLEGWTVKWAGGTYGRKH